MLKEKFLYMLLCLCGTLNTNVIQNCASNGSEIIPIGNNTVPWLLKSVAEQKDVNFVLNYTKNKKCCLNYHK